MSFNRDLYRDIAPYDEAESEAAVARILAHPEYIYAFSTTFVPGEGAEVEAKRKQMVEYILSLFRKVHSYDDFQHIITAGIFIPFVLQGSVDNFSVSGAENLRADEAYLFISNHRDIVLDCTFLDYALLKNNLPICEMAIGDNLLSNQFVTDLLKLNGGIVVKRDLPMREKYLESIKLSGYFVDRIESGKSIWVAQKSGRSKDGIDTTHPAVIKMLYLSKKKSGITFPELIKKVNIVPVAVRYEFDPNDINKGREEIATQKRGTYEKKKLEDTLSMIRGIRKKKGNIHVAIGKPLKDDYDTPEAVALAIDKQIHTIYKLWPSNYFAYDYMEGSDTFRERYENFDTEKFLSSYNHLDEDVRSFVINSYANPVRSYLKDCECENGF